MNKQKIAENIVHARILKRKTAKEVSEYLNITPALYSSYEDGSVSCIKLDYIEKIAIYLNVDIRYLLGFKKYVVLDNWEDPDKELTNIFYNLKEELNNNELTVDYKKLNDTVKTYVVNKIDELLEKTKELNNE